MKFLLCVLLFVTVASAARPSYNSPLADDRQLFYGDLAGMKTKRPTVESNYNHYEGDEYQPINDYKKPAYYEKPAPKPYKPTPEYPKEVVLLKPSAALKANAYSYKHATPDYKPHAVPGTPGKDYPNYDYVPQTGFDCLSVKKAADYSTDYYSNYMIPDREAGCQVFHSCHPDGRQDSFLCPLGTIFDGETQTCDWWFNARCY